MDSQGRRSASQALGRRLGVIACELAIVGAAWWYFGLKWPVGASLFAAIVVSGLVPERYESLASGAGLLGISALVHFGYGAERLAIVLAAIGVLMLIRGAAGLRAKVMVAEPGITPAVSPASRAGP